MNHRKLELVVDAVGYDGKRFEVAAGVIRLGRSSSNDIAIRDEELSRNHCLFERSDGDGIRLTDLASANGTFLNGKRIGAEPVDLAAGDVITVGSARISVVRSGESVSKARPAASPSDVDLGLGTRKESTDDAVPKVRRAATPINRRLVANALWVIVIAVLAAAVYTVLDTPGDKPKIQPVAPTEEKPELREMTYELVKGDSKNIFRYYLTLSADGTLHVIMDDLTDNGRHLDRTAMLGGDARKRLAEILFDPDFMALDREYVGPNDEPPRLDSCTIAYLTASRRKQVRVVNMPEPEAFHAAREKIRTFSMNELGIRGLEYSREQLIAMARESAESARVKWEDRDVEYGNLYSSIRAYREALADLETVNPKPPEYEKYSQALSQADSELKKRYEAQCFTVEQAISVRDWERARAELRILCDLVPDRDDERNRTAMRKLLDVENRLHKKGGAR